MFTNLAKIPTFLLFFFLFLTSPLLLVSASAAENVSFDFPTFNFRNLTLLGDSYLRDGLIGLTREMGVPVSSSGSVIYNYPIAFLDPQSNSTASFSTRFSFSVININPASFGDGLVFFLCSDNQTLGRPGAYMGLVNSSQLNKNKFVGVEFDTKLDLQFEDPNDNHIGLDIDSFVSIRTADLMRKDISLRSGKNITAWIEYMNDEKKLSVFLSYSTSKPEKPLLAVNIGLSSHLKESMFVGFSASTEGSTQLHKILNWTFQTFGFQFLREKRNPYNVSGSSVILKPPIPVPDSNSLSKRHRRLGLGLVIGGPAFFSALLVVFGWISVKRWKAMRPGNNLQAEIVTGPRKFTYKEIKSATKGFHSSRIIGRGAFGTVYKAFFISSGTTAAVKRSKHENDGKTGFFAELSVIASLRHKNLVQLQGWCVQKGELFLVYELMPNGSLDEMLYQQTKQVQPLTWSQRYNIAVGLASALSYLHQECDQQVIHRDIKSSNIMLDALFNARLGDFGLAKLLDHNKSPVSTLTAGTVGYLAPEYLQCGLATDKTDIFSYGVVVLEVACGRRPIDKGDSQKTMNLVDWVWGLHSQGKIIEAADKRLNGEFKEEGMRKLLLVGLSCANPDSLERPSMRRVLQILNDEAEPLAVPQFKPSLSFSYSLPLSLEDIILDDEGIEEPESHSAVKVQ